VFGITIAFLIALVILGQGITAPFEKDAEPQSAQWVAGIVQQGHWLLPHDYYGFVNRKPPLFYWLSAALVEATGGNLDEVRARIVSLVAGAALAASVMGWSVAKIGTAQGWLAFFFLIGTYGFASRATVALTDMLMSLILFALYCVLRPALKGAVSWRKTFAAGVLLGLAILTKGPVTIVIVALAASIYLLISRRSPLVFAAHAWPWMVLALAIGIAAAWYVPAFLAGRASGLTAVFVDENFGHFMPASMGGTGEAVRPVYYILLRLLGGAMPLTFLLPALPMAFVYRAFPIQSRKPLEFQLAMVLAVLLLFSAASAKRDDYILPALPPLAILFAALFTEPATVAVAGAASPASKRREYAARIRDATVALIALAMIAGTAAALLFFRRGGNPAGLGFRPNSADASYAAIFADGLAHLTPPFIFFTLAVTAGSTIVFAALWRRCAIMSGAGLAILCLAGSILWTGTLRPAEARTRSLAAFAAAVRSRVNGPLYVAWDDPEFAWYYGRGVPALPREIARSGPSPGTTVYFVARPPELLRLAPPIRDNLKTLLRSDVLGGAGPPALYLIQAPTN
jgi:4-amino-4-deoxy-L-arabinose transferase-like glycosyltransferase